MNILPAIFAGGGVDKKKEQRKRFEKYKKQLLVAATALYHHILVLLQDHIRAFVKVEHRDAAELGGGAAGLRHVEGRHKVDEGLDYGVVGGVHVGVEGEGTLAVAVEGGIAVRGYDPVLPAQVPASSTILVLHNLFKTVQKELWKSPINLIEDLLHQFVPPLPSLTYLVF